MNTIGNVLTAPFQAIGLIPKAPKLPAPTPIAQTDEASVAAEQQDQLAQRRGGAADIIGDQSGEAVPTSATSKATLGS